MVSGWSARREAEVGLAAGCEPVADPEAEREADPDAEDEEDADGVDESNDASCVLIILCEERMLSNDRKSLPSFTMDVKSDFTIDGGTCTEDVTNDLNSDRSMEPE